MASSNKVVLVTSDENNSLAFVLTNSRAWGNYKIKFTALTLSQVKQEIDKFIKHAEKNHDTLFRVKSFGFKEDIAPMFALAPVNCMLPKQWEEILPAVEGRVFWVS